MKSFNLSTAVVGALAACWLVAGTAHAATISFVPAGAQLDGDAINDIEVAVGDTISFDVYIDTIGLAGPLQNFKYTATWDPAELVRTGLTMDNGAPGAGGNFGTDTPPGAFLPTGATVSHGAGAVPAGSAAFLLDTWTFKVADGLVNDGKVDFSVTVFNAESPVNGVLINQNGKYDVTLPNGMRVPGFQQVEVQPAAVVPEPEIISLMGAGALVLLGMRRRAATRSTAA